MEKYENNNLYLDNDTPGQNCSRYALILSNKFKGESDLFKNCKDLNDWLIDCEKIHVKKIKKNLS